MDGKHPEIFDQRPKRRPNEDNPYKLYTVGIKTDHPHYYLSFRDSAGAKQFMEIDKALFDAFDRFEQESGNAPEIRRGNRVPAHGGGGSASGHHATA